MFTAEKVVFEFVADIKKLNKEYKAQARIAVTEGDKIGDKFTDGFDGEARGRGIMASLTSGIKKGAPALKTALKAGTALATVGVGLAAGFAATSRAAIGQAADMKVLADTAGVTAERFQELRYGASQFGIDGEKVSDILKDVNDKFGDFNATGAGPLADFFENVAPKVGLLAEDFRDLSSDEALGLYVSSLEKAGANSQDFAFYMEAIAGDATMLLPLLKNNGEALDRFSTEARGAGIILSNEAAQGAQDADQKFNELGATLRGNLVVGIVENADAIAELTQDVIDFIPTILGWADNIGQGFDNLAGNLERLDDKFQASFLGSGKRDKDPEVLEDVNKRLETLVLLNQVNDKFIEEEKSFFGRLNRSRNDALRYELGVKIFGEEGLKQLRDGGRDFREAIRIEYNRTGDMLKDMQPDIATLLPPVTPDVDPPGGIGGGGAKRIAEREAAEAKAAQAAARAAQKRIDDANKLRQANLTAEETYQADLAAIREVESDPMLLEVAGGEETVMRARIDALVDLAQASDDVGAAHIALAQAIEQGTLTEDAALEAATRLNTEFGLFTKAQLEARDALEKKNDELVTQIEYQRALAEASGDYTEVTRLTRELEVLRQKGDLLRENLALSEKEAEAKAQADVDKLSKAQDLAGFDELQSQVNDEDGGLENELARITEREEAKLELLESYRTAETESLREFEALKTQIEREAEEERRAIKLEALDDQLALAEGVFGGISDLLKAAGKEDSKAAKAAAKAEKVIAIGRATVNTALGVSRALAEQPFPLNFITAGLVGAAGAIQIATIASSFKDGVVGLEGPGTERSDSIPARLSKGESVITARATRGNELGLTRLNAGMSPEEAFGLGRTRRGYMDGVVAVGVPMSQVPSVTAPDNSEINRMAMSAPSTAVTNNFDIVVKDDKLAYAYADEKQRETEAKVPGISAADKAKQERARPK